MDEEEQGAENPLEHTKRVSDHHSSKSCWKYTKTIQQPSGTHTQHSQCQNEHHQTASTVDKWLRTLSGELKIDSYATRVPTVSELSGASAEICRRGDWHALAIYSTLV